MSYLYCPFCKNTSVYICVFRGFIFRYTAICMVCEQEGPEEYTKVAAIFGWKVQSLERIMMQEKLREQSSGNHNSR